MGKKQTQRRGAPARKLIVGIGEVLWDLYGDEKFPGGAPANFAYHVHHLGHDAYIISRVGRDSSGDELLDRLSMAGLETRWIQRDVNHPTGTVKVSLDRQGVPRFHCSDDVAFDYLEPAPQWQTLYGLVDAVLFGTLAQRNEQSRNAIREFLSQCTKALRVYDVNIRGWDEMTRRLVLDSMPLADVLKLNDEERHLLSEAFGFDDSQPALFLRFLAEEFDLQVVALTLGHEGCVLANRTEVVYEPGLVVEVEDTTGAGDAFAAGLVVKLLEGAHLREIARFANALGALVATRRGATPGWNLTELRRFSTSIPSRAWSPLYLQFA
ncbi:MAG: carbohydrate kinase [candidate division KSB1 bacterium]|nr:carbohydrate kinase [candidate division KSB1 bacterium]MDZ7384652.1 carbohydrate kinase [candidate division KSB1 bacterium]MDZ7393094.1 carbohydrate kinase [candidate division KSB1 bacterium]MDZ7412434.1 carbohydrate kinase [candidate division KSB1 bacterium]